VEGGVAEAIASCVVEAEAEEAGAEALAAVGGEGVHVHDVGGAAGGVVGGRGVLVVDHSGAGDELAGGFGDVSDERAGGDRAQEVGAEVGRERRGEGTVGGRVGLEGEAERDQLVDVGDGGETEGRGVHGAEDTRGREVGRRRAKGVKWLVRGAGRRCALAVCGCAACS
jgi:hypothetical protein